MTERAPNYFPAAVGEKKHVIYAVHDPSVDVEILLGYAVPVSDIPRRHLFGIQTQQEYECIKRRRVRTDYQEHPELLAEHPILTCAYPAHPVSNPDQLRTITPGLRYNLMITDGHHRTRYAPRGVRTIPGRILTVEEALHTMPNLAHFTGGETPDENLMRTYEQLGAWMRDTIYSFVEQTGKQNLLPYPSILVPAENGGYVVEPV